MIFCVLVDSYFLQFTQIRTIIISERYMLKVCERSEKVLTRTVFISTIGVSFELWVDLSHICIN